MDVLCVPIQQLQFENGGETHLGSDLYHRDVFLALELATI